MTTSSLSTLVRVFARYRFHIIALVAFGTLSALLEGISINAVVPLISFFTGGVGGTGTDFITRIIQNFFFFFGIPFSFRYLLAFILGLFILRALSMIVFGYIRGWIGADFLGKESGEVLRKTLTTSWGFLLKQKIGSMHNTLVRDIQCTGDLLSVVAQVVQSFTGFLMYLLVAMNISPYMTMYTLGGGAFVMLLLRPLFKRARFLGGRAASIEKEFSQFLSEHIIGMKAIKAAGAEHEAIQNGTEHINELRSLSIRKAFTRSLSSSLFQPAGILLVVILFLLSYNSPSFNIISFAATLYLIQKIFTYLESGQSALIAITELVPYAENLESFKRNLTLHSEKHEEQKNPYSFDRAITFNSVSFSYTEQEKVLHDVSFTIEKGKTIGLIGPSGSGKTSVVDLLLQLFTPQGGTILLDDHSIQDISVTEWRKHIGYVSQDIFLLNGTIEENIRFYNTELTTADIEEAAKLAHIYDFVQTLPEKFETRTGDRGLMLSGGQRQRIVLARALAARPDILLLDEATSALDRESEQNVQEAIQGLRGKMTVVVIAHRLQTIENVDTIIVLEQGRITEQGSPKELLSNPESYYSKHSG
jgi:ABC-type multidrug transport system fused ATPase/permease subunit